MSAVISLRPLNISRVRPEAWFGISAVFHYLGPAFAVLLFPAVGVLGVAWVRIASAALLIAPFSSPLRLWRQLSSLQRVEMAAFGASVAAMNCAFYVALSRLPLSLVAAIEFAAPLLLALYGRRTIRNVVAVAFATVGVALLLDLEWRSNLLGLSCAALNALLFAGYLVFGHRLSRWRQGSAADRLSLMLAIAAVIATPIGLATGIAFFRDPRLLAAGFGVGLCSSVIPYLCDQLAMARLQRGTYALMMSLLPVSALVIGALVLGQFPSAVQFVGGLLVVLGVAMHRPSDVEM